MTVPEVIKCLQHNVKDQRKDVLILCPVIAVLESSETKNTGAVLDIVKVEENEDTVVIETRLSQ